MVEKMSCKLNEERLRYDDILQKRFKMWYEQGKLGRWVYIFYGMVTLVKKLSLNLFDMHLVALYVRKP